jgi:hypothetical protein
MTRYIGNATTYISQAATNRFWNIDRIMFAMSPYLTDEETWKIVEELERMSASKTEGNFSPNDALNWVAEQLGGDRYQALCMAWTIDNQAAVTSIHSPEELREAWVHKLTMTEGTADEVRTNPNDYILIKTTRNTQH